MTHIYVVVADYGDDGYGEPEGAYSSRELAESAIKKWCVEHFEIPYEILEITLDAEL